MDYKEDSTGLAPVQGVQAGCHSFLWSAPEDRCTECDKNRIWVRNAQGWIGQNANHDEVLPYLIRSPFSATHLATERAIVAPSCLDAYTYDMERELHPRTQVYPEVLKSGIVDVLAWHPGEWSPHTARFLGKAMAHDDPEVRASAAELLSTKLASVISAEVASQEWAQIDDVILGRWAASLADAATLNPVFVRDLLTSLLPQLDRKTRDIAKLIKLLHNVRLQTGQDDVDKQLLEWLSEYKGKTKAATAAAEILKEAK